MRWMKLLLSTLVFFLIVAPEGMASDRTWDDLVEHYAIHAEDKQHSMELRERLLAQAPSEGERSLWEGLWKEQNPSKRASMSLALVQKLFPDGDPSRWEEISGFWRPQEIPRSLAALDAVYVASLSLVEIGTAEPGARALALGLLESLSQSSRARYHAFLRAPEEYRVLNETFADERPPLLEGKIVGSLPFAHPVRGSISSDGALFRRMTMLNNMGQVAQGAGSYAWDRKKGKIFRVRDTGDDNEFVMGF